MMKKLAGVLLCFLLFASAALAEETALPQLIPVTFPDTYQNADLPAEGKENYSANAAGFSSDGMSYHDDSLDVQLHQIHVYDTDVTVAFIQIASPSQLRTELAKPYPSKTTIRPIQIAERVNAVLAVNGDWFTYHNMGIVYRNFELLLDRPVEEDDGLVIDANGDFHIVRPMTREGYAELSVPIMHSFAFGPTLVMDGQVQEIVGRKVTYRQRNAIGQVGPLSYVFVVTEGTNEEASGGLSVPQLAQLMYDLGAKTAYNLDGGQSAFMFMNKGKVNGQPKNMRAVGDIIYFATAVPGAEE